MTNKPPGLFVVVLTEGAVDFQFRFGVRFEQELQKRRGNSRPSFHFQISFFVSRGHAWLRLLDMSFLAIDHPKIHEFCD